MIMNCNFDKLTLNLLTKEELVELLEKCQDNKLTENTNKIDSIDNELLKIKKQYEYQKKKLNILKIYGIYRCFNYFFNNCSSNYVY